MPLFAIQMPGPTELILILVIVLIFFGAGRLPEVFASFGKGIKSFKDAQKDDSLDVTPKLEGKDTIDAAEIRERARAEEKR
jgi:sec-independent protein translocase protein TatA